jgi:IS30 family transposase
MSKYRHISRVERLEISLLHHKSYAVADIALELGRHRSSIYRELRRNAVAGEYNFKKAQQKAYVKRKYAKYQAMRIIQDVKLRQFIETKLLDDQWSPEQIAGRLARESGLQKVSAPTIYNFIRSPYGRQLEYELDLVKKKRSASKQKWQRKVTNLEDRIFIDQRPEAANARKQYGHWEADFIVSGKAYGSTSLAVLHERVSRYTLIRKIDARTAQQVEDVLVEALPVIGPFKSLTLDNDIAFKRHRQLSELLDAPIYFCEPYHSWEKGGVENINRLIRRYVPKGCDIAAYSHEDIRLIQNWANGLPRKILGFKTATEMFAQYQKEASHA